MLGTPDIMWMLAKIYQQEMLAEAERERLAYQIRQAKKRKGFFTSASHTVGRWLMRMGRALLEQTDETVPTQRKRHA